MAALEASLAAVDKPKKKASSSSSKEKEPASS
jgi:hypothetical protein